jgi:hypothetical protein
MVLARRAKMCFSVSLTFTLVKNLQTRQEPLTRLIYNNCLQDFPH